MNCVSKLCRKFNEFNAYTKVHLDNFLIDFRTSSTCLSKVDLFSLNYIIHFLIFIESSSEFYQKYTFKYDSYSRKWTKQKLDFIIYLMNSFEFYATFSFKAYHIIWNIFSKKCRLNDASSKVTQCLKNRFCALCCS